MPSLLSECLLGGIAAASATVLTNPAEIVKIRFQLQGEQSVSKATSSSPRPQPYQNLQQSLAFIVRHDGFRGIQRGLVASMAYQFLMNGIRFGSYQALDSAGLIREKDGHVVALRSAAAGGLSGCVSAWIGNPLFVVKTRMQAQSNSPQLVVGEQHKYRSVFDGLYKIHRSYGMQGLWKGASASVVRVAVASAAQLSVFSTSKDFFARHLTGGQETHTISFLGSLTSGLLVVSIMHPFDLICTRIFNQKLGVGGEGKVYSGMLDCTRQLLRLEGIRGLYSGYWAGYFRLAPHTFLCLLFWDELRRVYQYYT